MVQPMHIFFSNRGSLFALALACGSLLATAAQGAILSHGNFGPVAPGVSFLNVTESSGTGDSVPLYGAPTPFATGLDFNPVNFLAMGSGGAGDITDGQLNFTIFGQDGGGNDVAISTINLSESGVYDLTGTGTAATQIAVGAILNVKITEIDGVAVTPITLFGNASLTSNLVATPGDEVDVPWNLNILIDVQAELTTLGVPFTVGATRADVFLNNTLTAISEALSTAEVVKNDFVISIVPKTEVIPEPSTLAMAAIGLCGLGLRRTRKQS